jgi:hypothetical protein
MGYPKKHGWAEFELREDGIFLRGYNVRLATFSPNSHALQQSLARLFDRSHKAQLKEKQNVQSD